MNKTIFEITKTDCPPEENQIRLKLDGVSSIANLDFDIPNQKLTVFHSGEIEQIEKSIIELNSGIPDLVIGIIVFVLVIQGAL
jgi:hypothetical protein